MGNYYPATEAVAPVVWRLSGLTTPVANVEANSSVLVQSQQRAFWRKGDHLVQRRTGSSFLGMSQVHHNVRKKGTTSLRVALGLHRGLRHR